MDKKNTVIGALLLAAAFVALYLTPKPTPSPLKPATTATPVVTAPAAGGSAVTAPSAGPSVAVVKEASSATVTTLANDFIEVRFTNFGGAIRDVALRQYPAVQGKPEPFVFNELHADPMLGFVNFAGVGFAGLSRDTPFELVSQTATDVVYRTVLRGNLEVTRHYSLAPNAAKDKDPYQLRHETTFRNLSNDALNPSKVALALGTAALAHVNDSRQQPPTTGYASDGKFIFIQSTDFLARGGMLGMGARDARGEISSPGPVTWASVKNQFFTTILTPDVPASGLVSQHVKLLPDLADNIPAAWGISGATEFELPAIAPHGEAKLGLDFYVGPKEYRRLANTDVFKANQDKVMQFGKFFGFFSQLLSTLMTWMHGFAHNWGLAIILTTLTLKIATLPLTLKASKSMKRMQKLSPEMKIIREKFKDNPQKQQVAMMELYKQHKVNPLGGCIPMLLPMPFFFGFYSMLQGTAELRFAPFLWAHDLSMPDTVGHLFGFPINILPLLLGVTMLVQMQLTPQANVDKAQATMMKFMPLFFLWVCYNFSCALSLYSTVNGLFTIVQQVVINRMKDDGDPTPAINDRLKNVTPAKKKKA